MFITVKRIEKLALCYTVEKKLEGIIIEVSKTLMGIEKGETGNGSKAKEDRSRKEQKALH